jgi:hypothetical protein
MAKEPVTHAHHLVHTHDGGKVHSHVMPHTHYHEGGRVEAPQHTHAEEEQLAGEVHAQHHAAEDPSQNYATGDELASRMYPSMG